MQSPVSGNIYKLLEGDKQYIVPVYQRTYNWSQSHCERLWFDILEMQMKNRDSHFIGTIVTIADQTPAVGIQEFMIIDGQQRLTTLTLLLLAIRDYARAHPDCDVNPNEIHKKYLVNDFEKDDKNYRLCLTLTDRDILFQMIDSPSTKIFQKSRIYENYTYFTDMINKGEISLRSLYEAIGKLLLVSITLDRGNDDPQAIFESLNSTGKDLEESDLIRNHLLMGLASTEQARIYKEIWRPTEMLFDYDNQSILLDKFFRDYLTMKNGKIPREKDVYKEFKKLQSDNVMSSVENLCLEIYRFAKYYSDIHFMRSEDAILNSLYKDIKAIGIEVAYPFFLKIHDDCHHNLINIDELSEILNLCVSYTLRRAVCDIPTNSLNKTFATMKNDIDPYDYLNSIKAKFALLDTYKEFPNDERFAEAFKTREIYKMKRCHYILGKLEKWDNKTPVDVDNLTIEHILPQNQNLSYEWKIALGNNWNEVQRKCLHTIGNLTLTAYNVELSDDSFNNKLNMNGGYKEGALRINKYVITQETWAEQQICERAELLGEIAKNAWPYPNLTESEFAPYKKQEDIATKYSIDSYKNINPFSKILFEMLNVRITNLDPNIKRVFNRDHISYKTDDSFVDIIVQKDQLCLKVYIKYDDVYDPKGICTPLTSTITTGNIDVEVRLPGLDHLDDVMEIVEQSFLQQETG